MNPKVIHAQRACEAAKARQAVVVFIDEVGQYAVASYGETRERGEHGNENAGSCSGPNGDEDRAHDVREEDEP